MKRALRLMAVAAVAPLLGSDARAQGLAEPPTGPVPRVAVEGARAATEDEMRPYVERIPGAGATLAMTPIPGGTFSMGSPASEAGRRPDEGPVHEVEVAPFWMATTEVTWDLYHVFMLGLDLRERARGDAEAAPQDAWADAVSRPTPPYVPMDFGMGVEGHPAICMTQFAAKQFTKWLSMKTGRFYRLPTEAEWEYACRAGAATAYAFGDDAGALAEHAWYRGNSEGTSHPVARWAPNAWGLFDMHGNVAEWVLDGHDADLYGERADGGPASNPVAWPGALYPRVVRGGSWDDDAEELRCAARGRSSRAWQMQDPQIPKSIWYHTDATFVGFRVVRPLAEPQAEQRLRYWEADLGSIRSVEERQRQGGR